MPLAPVFTWPAEAGSLSRPGHDNGDPQASEPYTTVTIDGGAIPPPAAGFGTSTFGTAPFGQ